MPPCDVCAWARRLWQVAKSCSRKGVPMMHLLRFPASKRLPIAVVLLLTLTIPIALACGSEGEPSGSSRDSADSGAAASTPELSRVQAGSKVTPEQTTEVRQGVGGPETRPVLTSQPCLRPGTSLPRPPTGLLRCRPLPLFLRHQILGRQHSRLRRILQPRPSPPLLR